MTSTKPGAFWSVVWLLIVFGIGTLPFFVYPTILTGRYYEITITSVEFEPEGYVSIAYDDVLTYGARYIMDYVDDQNREASAASWWAMHPGFLWRPKANQGRTVKLSLATESERRKGIDTASVQSRLQVTKGTYRIPIGNRLEWVRRTNPDGTVSAWNIEAHPDY